MMRCFRFAAGDATLAAAARQSATRLAAEQGLDEHQAGKVSLVVTEAATNLVKHGGGGEILVGPAADAAGVSVLALDRGPGMANPAACLRDGFSTSGTSGTGLGAISRLATRFDIHSVPGAGTVLMATVALARQGPRQDAFECGGVSVPAPEETVCGDAWATAPVADGVKVIVVDGLGHGPLAHEAAAAAVQAFRSTVARPLPEAMEAVHGALKSTRGAAVALASIDVRRRIVTFIGIGNIMGGVLGDGPTRSMVSHGGIAGHGTVRVQPFTYPWPERGGMLVMCSDGITTQWSLDGYPGLRQRDPAVIAGVLYRDHVRGRDDATVVVVRERAT
jgi:anti-sigma regulatory factor (Ser/Thr protein kinase)